MRAILNFFRSKTITFEKAKQEGEITEEKLVREGENLFLCGNGIYPYTDGKSLDMLIDKLGGGGGNPEKNPGFFSCAGGVDPIKTNGDFKGKVRCPFLSLLRPNPPSNFFCGCF
ncbi:hypothetical protein, partial [Helicobacter sp. CLO-3]|uniref:hypothetical protein n=2 Tax=Helicobacter sp. CLO-3 TaxID=211 RepID=UPI001C40AD60